MKNVITILAVLTLIAAGICFYFFPFAVAMIFFVVYLIVVSIFVYCYWHDEKLQERWLQSQVFPDSPQLEDMFWSMTMSNKDWYIEHILKEEGVKQLIQKYETTIREIWNDRDWEISEKIERSSVYVKRLKSMLAIQEFNALHRD